MGIVELVTMRVAAASLIHLVGSRSFKVPIGSHRSMVESSLTRLMMPAFGRALRWVARTHVPGANLLVWMYALRTSYVAKVQ